MFSVNFSKLINKTKIKLAQLRSVLFKASQTESAYSSNSDVVALEERIMLSASPMAVVADGEAVDLSDCPDDNADAEADQSKDTQIRDVTSIVFVDSSVEDYEQLVNDIDQSEGDIEVVLLDSDSDGIDQISEYLANYSGIESVHIVSHGTDGEVRLGNTVLNADSLERYAGQIAAWGSSFTSSADILFYGCDLAATEDGELVLEALSELTGADINASNDLTGHAALGGDWDLEYVFGHIETDVIFSASVQENWYHTLATFTVTTPNDVVDAGDGELSLREAVIAANDNLEADTIVLGPAPMNLTISGTGAAAGDLNIESTITIQGAGAQETSIAGAASGFDSRLFSVFNSANLTLQGMTVEGGSVSSGAAVFVFSEGSLEATDVVFRDNHSNLSAGAIFASGDVTLNRVALINNTSGDDAGAIRVSGTNNLDECDPQWKYSRG